MRPIFVTLWRKVERLFLRDTDAVYETVETSTAELTKTVDGYVAPVRKTIFKRFPIFFTLLVTTGFAATILGIEQVILRYQVLQNNPEIILLFGVTILVFTGTLYKKLG